jgi:hypothetical protein
MTRHFVAFVMWLGVPVANGYGQLSSFAIEEPRSVSVSTIAGNAPTPVYEACRSYRRAGWARIAADSSVVISALPYLVKGAPDRAVAYFKNNAGHLLQCIDGPFRSGCGERHVTYRLIDSNWVKDEREVVIVC